MIAADAQDGRAALTTEPVVEAREVAGVPTEAVEGVATVDQDVALEDAELRRELSRFSARIESARLNGLRTLTRQVRGELTQSDASINKLHNCNLLVSMAEMGMERLGGASPYVGDSEASEDQGRWQVVGSGT